MNADERGSERSGQLGRIARIYRIRRGYRRLPIERHEYQIPSILSKAFVRPDPRSSAFICG